MARRHGGLGRGLDALIPVREEVEKAMQSAESEGMELLFSDDEDTDAGSAFVEDPFLVTKQVPQKENVSRETSAVTSVKQTENTTKQITETDSASEMSHETSSESQSSAVEPENADSLKDAVTVRISEVEPNREQPRKVFDEEKLEELSQSIKTFGLLQPILVQKRDGYYEIIAGERRWRAALKAGLKEIPVVVRDYTEKEMIVS